MEMCFLTSVQMCMKWDLSIDYSLDQIKEKILNEVIDNLDLYQNYHTGNKLKLVQDTLAYMNLNKFTLDVVDVVVNACANSLDINMYIFSRNGDDALLLPTLSHNQVLKNQCIFLKYDRLGCGIHVGDHYSPIVDQPFTCTSTSTNVTNSTNTNIINSNTTTTTTNATTHTNQSSKVTNTCNSQVTNSMTQQDVTLISSQQLDTTLDTTITVPSNDIMDEILEACGEEDKEEEYFDLFGSPIDVTQTEATIDVGQDIQSGENVFQDLIDLTNVDPKSSINVDPISHTNLDPISSTNLDPKSSTNLDPKSHNLQETFVLTNENSDVEVVSSDNSERDIPQDFQHEDRPKQRKYAKSARLNSTKFLQMEKEYVNCVPLDVDDTHYYVISTNKDEWIDCSKDGHWYQMHTSS